MYGAAMCMSGEVMSCKTMTLSGEVMFGAPMPMSDEVMSGKTMTVSVEVMGGRAMCLVRPCSVINVSGDGCCGLGHVGCSHDSV